MARLCLFFEFRPYKGSFLCGGRVGALSNCSGEIFVRHASSYLDGHAVYSHVFEKCGCGVLVRRKLIKLVGASFLYTCLEKPYVLALPANFCADLPNLGGR